PEPPRARVDDGLRPAAAADGAMKKILLLLALAAPAHAATFYGEADLGAVFFLGTAGEHADPGPALGARIGFGPTPRLYFCPRVAGSPHEASVPTPSVGQFFQLYEIGLDIRAAGQVGAFGLFVEGGGGWSFISTNILDSVGVTEPYRHHSPYIGAGGGIEYPTDNPRHALGLADA